jgi:HAD superfamily hydrolase (TIGR01509 family)
MNRPSGFPDRIEAVLFDFDETMIDLEPQHDAAHRRLCAAMGSNYDDLPESFRFGSGRRIVDDITEMRNFFGWTRSFEDLAAERLRDFARVCRGSDLALMPGVLRTVHALHERGVRLAITTSADAGPVREILDRFAIRSLFSLIVDGREVDRGKPDPAAYLVTAGKLGVAPSSCIVFEDSHSGVIAAKRAGMYCVAVRNPHARQWQDLSPADVVLDSFEQFDANWISPSFAP